MAPKAHRFQKLVDGSTELKDATWHRYFRSGTSRPSKSVVSSKFFRAKSLFFLLAVKKSTKMNYRKFSVIMYLVVRFFQAYRSTKVIQIVKVRNIVMKISTTVSKTSFFE